MPTRSLFSEMNVVRYGVGKFVESRNENNVQSKKQAGHVYGGGGGGGGGGGCTPS